VRILAWLLVVWGVAVWATWGIYFLMGIAPVEKVVLATVGGGLLVAMGYWLERKRSSGTQDDRFTDIPVVLPARREASHPRAADTPRATGSCSTCGYAPVAFNASACPRCGASNPNPGVFTRLVGPGMLLGLFAGAVLGGGIGYASGMPGMWFGGALLGAIPGMVAGLVIGSTLGLLIWVRGQSGQRSDHPGTGAQGGGLERPDQGDGR
jgi:hypothetical protein